MFEALKKVLSKKAEPIVFVEAVYKRLSKYEKAYHLAGAKLNFRKLAPEQLVHEIGALSGDVETTVQLVRVLQQRTFSEGFNSKIDLEQFIFEAKEMSVAEATDYYESAKNFCDEIMTLVESGKISRNDQVRLFLDEHLTEILINWQRFRSRVREQTG